MRFVLNAVQMRILKAEHLNTSNPTVTNLDFLDEVASLVNGKRSQLLDGTLVELLAGKTQRLCQCHNIFGQISSNFFGNALLVDGILGQSLVFTVLNTKKMITIHKARTNLLFHWFLFGSISFHVDVGHWKRKKRIKNEKRSDKRILTQISTELNKLPDSSRHAASMRKSLRDYANAFV